MRESPLLQAVREKTAACVQCGYCLPSCPTYRVTGQETHSPRGRIHLVKMAAEGRLPTAAIADPLDLCLACRACETACPSGVEYGQIHAAARRAIAAAPEPPLARGVRRLIFRSILPYPRRLSLIANGLWAYQKSGIRRLVRRWKLLDKLPGQLGQWEQILPDLPAPHRRRLPDHVSDKGGRKTPRPSAPAEPAMPDGPGKVGLFHGCIMEVLYHRVNRLSMELLARCGYEVHLLAGQTCCGALHAHNGDDDLAVRLAKRNIEAAERAGVDWIVGNAGGCGAHMHEYPALFAGDPAWQARAQAFADKVRDISQLLWEAKRPQAKTLPVAVTYQPSCHLAHVQKVTDAPRKLIQSIPGIRYREIPHPELCCGSAGVYNLLHFDTAMQIVALKTANLRDMQVSYVVTSNPGCQLQMQMGIRREGLSSSIRVVHLVELLAEAWGIDVPS